VGSPTSYIDDPPDETNPHLCPTRTFVVTLVAVQQRPSAGHRVKIIAHYRSPDDPAHNSSDDHSLDKTTSTCVRQSRPGPTVSVITTATATPSYITDIEFLNNPRTLAQASDQRILVLSQQASVDQLLAPTAPFA